MNIYQRIKQQSTVKMCLEVGLLIGLVTLFIGYFYNNESWYLYSATCLFISLIWPKFWSPVAFIWFSIGEILGKIFSFMLLTLLFVFLVTPVGLIRRAFGKDSLNLKGFKKESPSHFIPVNRNIVPADMIYQF